MFTPDVISLASGVCSVDFINRRDTITFLSARWANCQRLSDKVLSGEFEPRYSKEIIISERGKRRLIRPPSFESKIVQKTLSEFILRPLLESNMIPTNYAAVREKGTDVMYKDIVVSLNKALSEKYKYLVQADFSNYFGSIPVAGLKRHVFDVFIRDKDILDLVLKFFPNEIGISLGNELSQLPASYYPTPLDKVICRDHKYFDRYMDDTLCVLKNKKDVNQYIDTLNKGAAALGLTIKPSKIHVYGMGADFSFCKERFLFDRNRGEYYQMINPKRVSTELRKLGSMPEEQIDAQYASVRGSIIRHPNCKGIVRTLDKAYKERTGKDWIKRGEQRT